MKRILLRSLTLLLIFGQLVLADGGEKFDSTQVADIRARIVVLKTEQAGLAKKYSDEYEAMFNQYTGAITVLENLLAEQADSAKVDTAKGN